MPIILILIPTSFIIPCNDNDDDDDDDDDDVVDGDDDGDNSNVHKKTCAYCIVYTAGMEIFSFFGRRLYRSSLSGGEWTYFFQDQSEHIGPKQNGRHYLDSTFKCIFLSGNCILLQIPLFCS